MPRYISPARLKYNAALEVLKRERVVDFGRKQVYLPKFTIALLRTPWLSPYHAQFRVPLQIAKPDLRDYLFHLYNIRAFNIRSYIKQAPVRDHQSAPRQMFREESTKYMTIEMEEPFVWPEEPTQEELDEEWGQSERKRQDEAAGRSVAGGGEKEEKLRKAEALRKQAETVLLERRQRTKKEKPGIKKEEEKLDSTEERERKEALEKMKELRKTEKLLRFPSIDDKRYKIKL
ncbi:hypothetical protein BDV96DRAFT_641288 [Lophiotrema nucula]|uniref:Large ribosomal subunit protein uL23m n=1 Tax=Lophiotrema nucula TaxID=690887 RepID=A0A6A5ZNQ1_9PLEO|nr:hypothetical protein BDV96DRAFT_641288 [Lophiotrema nucula]